MSVSTADISRVLDGVPEGLLINGKCRSRPREPSRSRIRRPERCWPRSPTRRRSRASALDAAVAAQARWAATDPAGAR